MLAVKSTLEAQHVATQAAIQALKNKVEAIEAAIKSTQEQAAATQSPPPPPVQPPLTLAPNEPKESLTEILSK